MVSFLVRIQRPASNRSSLFRPYHWGMKTSYIFGAILACSVIGTLVGARAAKTGFLVLTALLSLYGLFRLLG
jgi:hypothetical protein